MACANFDDSVTTENELDLITNDLEKLNIGLGFVSMSQKK